jgi:ElaB/YqjD/DUF883 family membrane-anchored ribosome-binding protein
MEETAKRVEEQVNQLQDVYEDGRRKINDLARTASDRSKQALTFTDEWVHQNPWLALGVIAGVGLIVGLLLGHAPSDD